MTQSGLGADVRRVLPAAPILDRRAYELAGGGRGIATARKLGPDATIKELRASGLRGRGGAGFPTGTKWQTVAGYASPDVAATVVVNGAEGEPGTFKDRAIMRSNPFAVVEGALVAAHAVGADRVVLALKRSFDIEAELLEAALDGCTEAGWCEGVAVAVSRGPTDYLFGEETALLEVLDGRPPFPRLAPPFRQGVDEIGPEPDDPGGAVFATPGAGGAPPTLVNNVETLANVPGIVADGAAWFRTVGSDESPGTVVCTVTGDTVRHGVEELAMATPLGEAIERVGGGAAQDRRLVAALSGVANPAIPAADFAVPLSHEGFRAIGSGLGAAGFIVFDDGTDLAAVAAGISRFLAVESCGQCTPCKLDGLAISDHLRKVCGTEGNQLDLVAVEDRLATVADGARCYLATQHQVVVGSLLRLFPAPFTRHVEGRLDEVDPVLVAPLHDIVDGVAVLDDSQATKQPDWSHDPVDSGKAPAERLAAS
jgi:NADH:ubiquinone oxidoreductase subunit F (NADH-binding)